jgi:outer membrane cobalamin receptor
MKNRKIASLLAVACLLNINVYADDLIEEIVVVGATIVETTPNVNEDFGLVETVMPAMAYTAGGFGGFSGYNERGAQTEHTTIFRNGVPVNDAGSGWYDFGHDIVTGQEALKIVSGPNSVLYGSGSLGGSVFITDDLQDGYVSRKGSNHTLVDVSQSGFGVTYFDVSNGSVRTDNDETDNYVNKTARLDQTIGGFDVNVNYTDYDYDYDNCYTASFSQSNDCTQTGNKVAVSVRNDNITLGYNKNNADYFTGDDLTYDSEAERFYLDVKNTYLIGTPAAELIVGMTGDQETYMDNEQTNVSGYASINFADQFGLGVRVSEDAFVYRVGYSKELLSVNFATSYRNPTLYQLNGDIWVDGNSTLEAEESMGAEVTFGAITLYRYEFEQGIQYQSGYTDDAGVYNSATYINSGEYKTQGIRFVDAYAVPYGSLNVMVGYTDSDQPRVPELKTQLSYYASFGDVKFKTIYSGMFDRAPGPYDGASLDDLSTLDFVLSRQFAKATVSFTVRDVFDNEFEVTPGYGAGGRKYFLTISSN